jgi:hypothetical protein
MRDLASIFLALSSMLQYSPTLLPRPSSFDARTAICGMRTRILVAQSTLKAHVGLLAFDIMVAACTAVTISALLLGPQQKHT